MKLYVISIILLIHCSLTQAQQGLERIIVEKYYVSNDEDEKATKGTLASGSVTYRIFVDMLPRYRFQAVYGIPEHPIKIATSSYFFNDEEFGGATANDIATSNLKKQALLLDSWISVCAGSDGNFAVLKSDDKNTIVDSSFHMLMNSNEQIDISLLRSDGLVPASPLAITSNYGMDSLQMSYFKKNKLAEEGQLFYADNSSWASFGGSIGLDTTNRVIIAQITTNGEFSFELNIQIGTPFGGVENYVAKDALNGEILFPGLNYKSEKKRIQLNHNEKMN